MEEEDNIEYLCSDCTERRKNATQKKLKEGQASFKKNDHVKIAFFKKNDPEKIEWMWVRVTKVDPSGKIHRGTLANTPIDVTDMQYGEPVAFSSKDIAEILNEP